MVRRDRTNQFGYVCPTENAAVWNADHPKKKTVPKTRVLREEDIKRQGIQKPEPQKELESFNQFLDNLFVSPEPTDKVDIMREIHDIVEKICKMNGVEIVALHLKCNGQKYVRGE